MFKPLSYYTEKNTADLNKPYSQYGKEELLEFAHREKIKCMDIIKKYSSRLNELTNNMISRVVRAEYSSCQGITLYRGIYHLGDGFELAVSNVGRGHRLKKAPDNGKAYYCFGFDKDDALVCAERFSDDDIALLVRREFIIRDNDMEYGLVFDDKQLLNVNAACYKEDKLLYTYTCCRGSISDVCLYEYDERGRRSYVLIVFDWVSMMNAPRLYCYEYDADNNLLGVRDVQYGRFIPVKGRHARKYITSARVTEAMKRVLSEWGSFPADVYVLSVYYEDNEADGTASFHLGYNTEEAVRRHGDDDDEARWNYAFWLHNEKNIFGDDNTIYVRYIESCGSLALLANAVKQLHRSGIITELFGHELPVIIHGLEYSPETAYYNITANGKRLLPREFIDFCGGIL